MYGFLTAFPAHGDLIRYVMERSSQMMNEECFSALMELEAPQQKAILNFVGACVSTTGEMKELCKVAVASIKKSGVIP